MFDLDALEAAGFTKKLTDEEWQQLQDDTAAHVPSKLAIDYVLTRGGVTLSTQQNTQEQNFGISTLVRYPEIVILEAAGQRVSCDASDTELILRLAGELQAQAVVQQQMQALMASGLPPEGR